MKKVFRRDEDTEERARAAHQATDYMGMDSDIYKFIDSKIQTEFVGYNTLNAESRVCYLIKDDTRWILPVRVMKLPLSWIKLLLSGRRRTGC